MIVVLELLNFLCWKKKRKNWVHPRKLAPAKFFLKNCYSRLGKLVIRLYICHFYKSFAFLWAPWFNWTQGSLQLIWQFFNSWMLTYQKFFTKATIERIYRVVSSQTNVKWVFVEILEGHGQPQKIIGWARPFFSFDPVYIRLFCLKCP